MVEDWHNSWAFNPKKSLGGHSRTFPGVFVMCELLKFVLKLLLPS